MDRMKVSEAKEKGIKFPEPVLKGSGDQYYDVVIARLDKTGVLGKSPRDALRNAQSVIRSKFGSNVVVLAVLGEEKNDAD